VKAVRLRIERVRERGSRCLLEANNSHVFDGTSLAEVKKHAFERLTRARRFGDSEIRTITYYYVDA
jgi:hypothetical protein